MPFRIVLSFPIAFVLFVSASFGAELKVGTAKADITPPKPVALDGQMFTRISQKVGTPLKAAVLALEGSYRDKSAAVVFVTFDMVGVRPELDAAVREAVCKAIPGFDVNNLVLSATHTHTGPVTSKKYHVAEGTDYMDHEGFVAFAAKKVAPAVAKAWNGRKAGKFSYGLDFAVVAFNRRAVYANGTAVMYGNTDRPDFQRMEGMEDHDIGTMFFWDENDKLLAMVVNVSCPAQEVEALSEIHADFWHPTRKMLHERFGDDIVVIAQCGAAGDMSPHTQYRNPAEERMRRLRNISRIDEIGRRIVRAVNDSYNAATTDKQSDVPLAHEYAVLTVPQHRITEAEYKATLTETEVLKKKMETDPGVFRLYQWARLIVERYQHQQGIPDLTFDIPIHVVRIGDTAVVTNPFELFVAFGTRLKARCKASQLFITQLTDGCGIAGSSSSAGYLPTDEAYRHGGYGATIKSFNVGSEGGQVLVEETLKRANALFE